MSAADTPYVPVACEFHDVIEGLAATRRVAQLAWRDEHDRRQTVTGRVTDVYARQGAEYLSMETGEVVRLDRLIEADGIAADRFAPDV